MKKNAKQNFIENIFYNIEFLKTFGNNISKFSNGFSEIFLIIVIENI